MTHTTTVQVLKVGNIDTSRGHWIILRRDNNRLGGHYGQHYYLETMNGLVVKVEDIDTYDADKALSRAGATARLYGAKLIPDLV